YDRWPSLQGFDHFYGFIGGEADQWQPPLFRDTTPVEMEIPKGQEGRYTLNDSLAEEVIRYIHTEKSVTPDRPFFVYYAPGATHAPHHAPKEWMAKFKGQFHQGWDKYREEAYQRQLKLGVIPPDTKLTPRPNEIPAWDSLTADENACPLGQPGRIALWWNAQPACDFLADAHQRHRRHSHPVSSCDRYRADNP